MSEPSIAVIIPMHNASRTIERTLTSVYAQSRPADAVAVVDDHSDDGCREVAKLVGAAVYVCEGTGAAAARNVGIRTTGAHFVAFLDADDCWPPNYLADVARTLANTGADMIVAPRVDVDELGQQFGQRPIVLSDVDAKRLLLRGNPITTSGTVVRTEAIAGVGGFDEAIRYCEDLDLWIRLLEHGLTVATSNEPTLYTVRDSQETLARIRDVENNRNRVLSKAANSLKLSARERHRAQAILTVDVGLRYMKSGHRLDALRCFSSALSVKRSWPLLALTPLPIRLQNRVRASVRAKRA
jgi:glycosyltransferase involved in cell wall biosynthesis